jgi:selenide, water dikinase
LPPNGFRNRFRRAAESTGLAPCRCSQLESLYDHEKPGQTPVGDAAVQAVGALHLRSEEALSLRHLFLEQDICPCAGERLEPPSGPVRLTELVESAGCASKIDQATLLRVLQGLPSSDDPRVLIGMPAGDDAGVYQLDEHTALVQTVDVFTPSVDDPYTFGQIAAANSLSDVYAMGGRPLTALSIIGFPVRVLPDEIMHQILRGGLDKMAEAGVAVIGGHSINDPQIKAGFAVTGFVPGADRLECRRTPGRSAGADQADRHGNPQLRRPDRPCVGRRVEAAARSMAALNKRAAELMVQFEAHACTDVTGFGLMGHLAAMAAAGRIDVEILWDDVPLLPGVLQCAGRQYPAGRGGAEQGIERRSVGRQRGTGARRRLDILFDAQTSGGLLIAVAESVAAALIDALRAEGCPEAAVIGRVIGEGSGRIFVRGEGRRTLPAPTGGQAAASHSARPREKNRQSHILKRRDK